MNSRRQSCTPTAQHTLRPLAAHRRVRLPPRQLASRVPCPSMRTVRRQTHAAPMHSHARRPRRRHVRPPQHAQHSAIERQTLAHAAVPRPSAHTHKPAAHRSLPHLAPHRRVRLPRRPLAPRPAHARRGCVRRQPQTRPMHRHAPRSRRRLVAPPRHADCDKINRVAPSHTPASPLPRRHRYTLAARRAVPKLAPHRCIRLPCRPLARRRPYPHG